MSGSTSDGRRDRNAYDVPPAQPPVKKPPDDTLTLLVAGVAFTGWTEIRVVRGVELFPSHFALELTERLPGQPTLFPIEPGQKCQVQIGSDLVLTGFVDTYQARVTPQGHEVMIAGRSATQDLVDCAAGVFPGFETHATMTFSAPSLLQLAQDLCQPFGITVTEPDGEGAPLVSIGDGIPQFTMPIGATVYDVLEPRAQQRQMLMLDGVDGNLVLAKVGTKTAASGVTMPGSALDAQVRFSKQDRFTVYLPAMAPFDNAMDVSQATGAGSTNYLQPIVDAGAFVDQPRWDGRDRYRPHFVMSDQYIGSIYLAEQLAKWELARRWGRSQAVIATVQGWRDSAGAVWAPNTLAPLDLPALKLQKRTWLISQVSYTKSIRTGTRTMLTLMPPQAFQPEPAFDRSFDPQLEQATRQSLTSTTTDRTSPDFNPRANEPTGGV